MKFKIFSITAIILIGILSQCAGHPQEVDPPVEDPREGDPPEEDSSAKDLSKEDSPAEDSPAEDPPEEDQPAENPPPEEDPPEEDPPAEDPPAEDPPAEDPPSDESPAEDPLNISADDTSTVAPELPTQKKKLREKTAKPKQTTAITTTTTKKPEGPLSKIINEVDTLALDAASTVDEIVEPIKKIEFPKPYEIIKTITDLATGFASKSKENIQKIVKDIKNRIENAIKSLKGQLNKAVNDEKIDIDNHLVETETDLLGDIKEKINKLLPDPKKILKCTESIKAVVGDHMKDLNEELEKCNLDLEKILDTKDVDAAEKELSEPIFSLFDCISNELLNPLGMVKCFTKSLGIITKSISKGITNFTKKIGDQIKKFTKPDPLKTIKECIDDTVTTLSNSDLKNELRNCMKA